MSDLLNKCDDIYTTTMIIAQRSKQIIDDRVIPMEEIEDVEDSIQFTEPEITVDNLERPMVQALEEYLNDELEWRKHDKSELESDEL